VQLKSSIPIVAKVEISPKGFTLGVKAKTQKNIFNLPQVTSKCWTLWPCIGPKGEKTSTIKFGKPICNPWGRTKGPKMLEVGSKFFSPDSWRKVCLVPTNNDKRIPNRCLLIGWMLLAVILSTEGAKVWTLFDIWQNKRYFTDYRNQNKSPQKVGVAGRGGDTIPH
jgi:hypothetical protein